MDSVSRRARERLGTARFHPIAEQDSTDFDKVLRSVQAPFMIGVGFLGAGTILKGDAESQVKGLTTAAGIWLTAAIGVAAGLGREATAVLSTVLALVVLWAIPMLHDKVNRNAANHKSD